MRGLNTAGKRKICLDGGLATQLEALGEDLSGDLWSAKLLQSDPDKILQAHADFMRAVLMSSSRPHTNAACRY